MNKLYNHIQPTCIIQLQAAEQTLKRSKPKTVIQYVFFLLESGFSIDVAC